MMIGQRWDLDVSSLLDFSDPEWEAKLNRQVQREARLHGATGIDYFVFPA